MEKILTRNPKRIPAFITPKAHAALPKLCELLAQEKGMSGVSYMDALSIAAVEALERRERELVKRGKPQKAEAK